VLEIGGSSLATDDVETEISVEVVMDGGGGFVKVADDRPRPRPLPDCDEAIDKIASRKSYF
jgi:hypothetical protein